MTILRALCKRLPLGLPASLLLIIPTGALACPQIDNLVDFNCDSQIVISVVGDSIVKGVGDLRFKNKGGYVKRLQKRFKRAKFVNMGRPGYASDRLFREFKSELSAKAVSKAKVLMQNSDLVIIDAGRNDFFQEIEAEMTLRNLKRTVGVLKKGVARVSAKQQPYVTLASLLPTTRGFQRPFIESVNALLFEFSSPALPVEIFFNLLDPELISVDGIHPASPGYDEMTVIAADALLGSIKTNMLSLRPDADNDGIYDKYERSRFGTNPSKKDTDGDGLKDGVEVFETMTDPLSADTDGDGVEDGKEVEQGSNPLDPEDFEKAPEEGEATGAF
ncbi:MAG: SGNH/GDSL hydrolase family protein [Deltaproteobacteria bacterium]|nr:SGNH/GDSL hydrolase family protein [Deltaproteobacteria bacterium]